MTYWTDDRRLAVEQARLDAAQAEAKANMEAKTNMEAKPPLAHASYIGWAKQDLEKAIRNLEVSADESGNALTRAIINNLKEQLQLLSGDHQLF